MLFRSVRAGPQVGTGRFQAGMEAEEAGLRAGPDRVQAGDQPEGSGPLAGLGRERGRALARAGRPRGRSGRGPGRARAGACGDRRRPAAVDDGREGQGAREGLGRKRASPGNWWRGWCRRGKAGGAGIVAGGRRPRLGSRGCTRRLRRPRPDSAGGEGETDPAELAIRFDLTGVQWSDGGEVGTHGGTEKLGEEEGKGEEQVRGRVWGAWSQGPP